jgi:hypothetical protein
LPARPTRDWCGEKRLESRITRCRSSRARASGLHYVRLGLVRDRFHFEHFDFSRARALSVGLGLCKHFFDPGRIGHIGRFNWRLDGRLFLNQRRLFDDRFVVGGRIVEQGPLAGGDGVGV